MPPLECPRVDDGAPLFIGVDLGWYGKPSGVAAMRVCEDDALRPEFLGRLESADATIARIDELSGTEDAVVAVDAPLVITNASGNREAERQLNREFRRFEAGCHPVNLGLPFAGNVMEFGGELAKRGFKHEPRGSARRPGRFQIEVYPHAAMIALFGLTKTLKYKRGLRADRALELSKLRRLLRTRLGELSPAVPGLKLPAVPTRGSLKPLEDRLDAVLCAYMAAYWWRWGPQKCQLFGSNESGAIVTPRLAPDSSYTEER